MNDKRREKIQFCVDHRQSDFTILMEDVQDNHNFGAVLRTCDAVGIYQAFLLQHRNILPRKGFILGKRSSMGSRKWVDVFLYKNPDNCMDRLKNEYKNIYTAMPGEGSICLYDLDLTKPFVMVFGNETEGISNQVLEKSDASFFIPQYGMAESLNVSVACAIALYEACRQRRAAGMYDAQYEPLNNFRADLSNKYMELASTKTYPISVLPIDSE